jgi:uncharacterized membrane protein YdjX (TVP38/TMEM64 family)
LFPKFASRVLQGVANFGNGALVTEALVEFLRRWGELNPTSAAVLACVFVAGGFVPVPRTFLALAAGVVYGMAAVPIIMPATTAGCLIAFLTARYLFAGWLWRAVQDKPKLIAIMNAVEAEGWRIVALCRLASPLPSTAQNALFGLTRIGVWPYVWSTFVFTIPQVLLYVYLGSIGKAALLGETASLNLGVMAAGGITFLLVILIITRRVRASMRELERSAAATR